jgi:hypothetical protein
MRAGKIILGVFVVVSLLFSAPFSPQAREVLELSQEQTIYVPAYSHIYSGNRERPFLLTVTVSIRNIDPKNSISVTAVDYYETQGRLLQRFLDTTTTLKPLESIRYVIPEKDKAGGSGANFIVEWTAETLVNPPIVETVMIGAQSQQGISFTSRGRVIVETD